MTADPVADNELAFKTKPALAVDILTDLHAAGILPPWVTSDEVYGRDKGLPARGPHRGAARGCLGACPGLARRELESRRP
jgi:hypothetical protein